MNTLIQNLSGKFKNLFKPTPKPTKTEVEGYLLMNDLSSNTFLVLARDGERCWKTKWFSNNEYIFKESGIPITEILKKPILTTL